jgi:protein-S-isoprenylcysteine O-methyltransferase Ste14
MGNLVSFLALFSLILGQLAIYHLHRRGRRDSWTGPTYSLSLPTRLFRWVKAPLYGALALHLVREVLLSRSAPAPRALLAALIVGATALVLLQWSLRSLGRNFAPCDRGILPRELVRCGPYRWLPHPIYTANLLLVAALAIASFGPLIVATGALLAVFYAFAIRDESRALRRLSTAPEAAP